MTEIRCRAIINWLRILGLTVRFCFPSGYAESVFARSKPLRGKDFLRCTGRGTLTAETCKNGGSNRRYRNRKTAVKPFGAEDVSQIAPKGRAGLPGTGHRRSNRRTDPHRTDVMRPDFRKHGTTGRAAAPRQALVFVTHIKFFASFSQERRGMAKGRRESGIHAEPRRPSRNVA